jgi:hypothetical protein
MKMYSRSLVVINSTIPKALLINVNTSVIRKFDCVCISAEVKLLSMQCQLPLAGPSTRWLIEFTLSEKIYLLHYCMVHAHGLITHQGN